MQIEHSLRIQVLTECVVVHVEEKTNKRDLAVDCAQVGNLWLYTNPIENLLQEEKHAKDDKNCACA